MNIKKTVINNMQLW